MKIIARLRNDFPDKFGLPRQSGLAESLLSTVVMEKEYAVPEAFRGIERYDRLWLLWLFDGPEEDAFSPTVRPPRLGGNERMGVFATRSPNRPNRIGMTCVKLVSVTVTEDGPVLVVAGADMRDGTAIVDIKPYVAYADSYPEAAGGFSSPETGKLEVTVTCPYPPEWSEAQRQTLTEVLSQDPRPAYQHDPDRVYRMRYAGYDVAFRTDEKTLTVLSFDTETGCL